MQLAKLTHDRRCAGSALSMTSYKEGKKRIKMKCSSPSLPLTAERVGERSNAGVSQLCERH